MSKHFNSKNVAFYPDFKLICAMPDANNSSVLANYCLLVSRVDEICRSIISSFKTAINCRPGCSACCRHLTIFPVEAAALAEALQKLPLTDLDLLAELTDLPEEGPCPFLRDNLCLVYEYRPIICRTHGLPILSEADGEKLLDYCPENFRNITSLPGSSIVNIDAVNLALVTINARFINESPDSSFRGKERFSFAEVIRLALLKNRLSGS